MNATPRVSVITIFLDAERFLAEAIESVLAQTYAHWELLLVDDGSTDGSTSIARGYASEHPARVRYLEHEGHQNRGMSASRNLGLRHARGEYIALLDADDVYLPEKLAEQVALLDEHPEAAMLYGRTHLWFSWTGNVDDEGRDSLTAASPQLDTLVQPPAQLAAYVKHEIYYPCTCSILIRRQILESVDGFEETFRGTYEDMVLYAKIFLRYPVYVADRCWDWYRQHPDSCWAVAEKTGQYVGGGPNPARQMFLSWLQEHIARERMQVPEVSRLVALHLLPYRYPRLYGALRVGRKGMRRVRTLLSNRRIPRPVSSRESAALENPQG